jgi:hypothetical protein
MYSPAKLLGTVAAGSARLKQLSVVSRCDFLSVASVLQLVVALAAEHAVASPLIVSADGSCLPLYLAEPCIHG